MRRITEHTIANQQQFGDKEEILKCEASLITQNLHTRMVPGFIDSKSLLELSRGRNTKAGTSLSMIRMNSIIMNNTNKDAGMETDDEIARQADFAGGDIGMETPKLNRYVSHDQAGVTKNTQPTRATYFATKNMQGVDISSYSPLH